MSELPRGWIETTLSEIGKWGSGGTPKATNKKYYGGTIPWAKIGDLNDGIVLKTEDCITEEGLLNSSAKLVETDTLLVAMYGSIGKLGIAGVRLATNQAIAFCKIYEKLIIKELAFYYLRHRREHLLSIGQGGTQQNISQTILKAYPILLPPLPEQHRIVAKLDSLFTRSRCAREELERIPKLIQRYKQAVLEVAFRGDLTADWRQENSSDLLLKDKALNDSKLNDISNLPDKWIWTNVSQVAKVTGGLTKNQSRTSLEKKVPYLRVANVYANELRLDEVLEIGVTKTEWERVQLKAGDLLIVEGNGSIDQIGRVALWNGEIEPCAHQNHLIKVRVGESISQKFLLYWLLSPNGRRAIELVASSSAGLHTLSISKVMALPIPLCSIREMKIIIQRVEKLFKAIDLMEQEYQKASKLCDRLEQATLAKAFRGELVPQDPNDEPASVLLERILAEKPDQPNSKAVKSKKSQSRGIS